MVFKSKVDTWLAVVMIAALTLSAWAVAQAVWTEAAGAWIGVAVLLVTWVFVGLVTVPVEYVLEDSDLVVRSGVWRTRIPYEQITEVRRTRSLLAGPAWSLDRLRVKYGPGRFTLISPVERDEFLHQLDRRRGIEPSGRL